MRKKEGKSNVGQVSFIDFFFDSWIMFLINSSKTERESRPIKGNGNAFVSLSKKPGAIK